ncbi:putative AC transposase [Bienertia sinuspersici]
MLKRALEAKDALVLFSIVDTSFDFSLTICVRFLRPFHSITELFSGSDYPTANLYFANVLAIEKLLVLGNNHEVDSIKKMASVMLEKFDKYWGDYSTFLAIAVVLDPWYKMDLVRSVFLKLYVPVKVEASVKEIYDALVAMYKFCDTSPTSSSAQSSHDLDSSCVSIGGAQSNVDAYLNSPFMAHNSETPFDILEYWKSQSVSFPFMSRIAKDVLAIPITSIVAESSFSMGGRVLTKYRSYLRTANVEAFDGEVEDCFEVTNDVMPNDVDHDSLPRIVVPKSHQNPVEVEPNNLGSLPPAVAD